MKILKKFFKIWNQHQNTLPTIYNMTILEKPFLGHPIPPPTLKPLRGPKNEFFGSLSKFHKKIQTDSFGNLAQLKLRITRSNFLIFFFLKKIVESRPLKKDWNCRRVGLNWQSYFGKILIRSQNCRKLFFSFYENGALISPVLFNKRWIIIIIIHVEPPIFWKIVICSKIWSRLF